MGTTPLRGFVALTSVVIISAVLIVLLFTLDVASFFSRFDALGAEDKRVSLGLAEACISKGMLKFAGGDFSASASPEPVEGGNTCRICSITPSGAIMARAVYHGAYSNLSVTINPTTYVVTSWVELATTPVGACTLP